MGRQVLLAGVSGTGKTVVGRTLAEHLGVAFQDADDLHPDTNLAKMTRGDPLDDTDRRPWLDAVGDWLEATPTGVLACSALRRDYRDRLRERSPGLVTLLLTADPALAEQRQAARAGHFMPTALLPSQLATLEPLGPDEHGASIDVTGTVADVVASCVRTLATLGSAT